MGEGSGDVTCGEEAVGDVTCEEEAVGGVNCGRRQWEVWPVRGSSWRYPTIYRSDHSRATNHNPLGRCIQNHL